MTNTAKIRNLSAVMAWVCLLPIVLLPIALIWFWSNFDSYAPLLTDGQLASVVDMTSVTAIQIVLAAILNLAAASVLLYGVWNLHKLFLGFRHGAFFTNTSVKHLYLFALMLFFSAILKILLTAGLSVLLTWNNPPGQKALMIQIGSPELSMLMIAGTILVVSWIMKEGKRLADENAEFV